MAFTDVQRRNLRSKLSGKYVKTRHVNGSTLSYVEGWHAIAEANRIFGYDAWDRMTVSTQCVWSRTIQGRYCCVYTAKVRITVRAGKERVVREGNGTGEGIGATAGAAHDVALKAAETDATKRALATFGNPFGLALYDKEKAGVRRSCKTSVSPNGGQVHDVWVFRTADGNLKEFGDKPKAFVTELRNVLASAGSLKELEAVWTVNCGELDRLRKEAPELKDKSNQHYADVLVDFCEARVQELQAPNPTPNPSKAYKVPVSGGFNGTGTIDKAALKLSEPKRFRNKEHLQFVASQPCLICDRRPAQAHHVQFAQPKAMASKVSDEFAVPLCTTHHQQLHHIGNEREWWRKHTIDPLRQAARLWAVTADKIR